MGGLFVKAERILAGEIKIGEPKLSFVKSV